MKRIVSFLVVVGLFYGITGTFTIGEAREWSRSVLWLPAEQEMVDSSKYKKNPPYKIGYANCSLSNTWAVASLQSMKYAVHQNKEMIKDFYVTDALDKPDKQIADVEDLIAKGIDLLIIRAATEAALDPIVTRVHKKLGIPVICFGRRVKSDNFDVYLTASGQVLARLMTTWICQQLGGKGNIVMFKGRAGASSSEERLRGLKEILPAYPGIKVLEAQYTGYSVSKGKKVMQAMIQSHGNKIQGLLAVCGIEASGGIEALHEAGMKVPITGEFLNMFMKRVQKWGYPSIAVGVPTSMGKECIETAIKILQGIPVPKLYMSKRVVCTTVDTEDVKSDVPWSTMTYTDRPDGEWNDHGLPLEWLPK